MKVYLPWLQSYFAEPLPAVHELVDAMTFHSSEVEEVIGEGEKAVLDIKVLADRAHYALSHRGLANEFSAALDRPLIKDSLRLPLPVRKGTAALSLPITADACNRHMGAIVRGVKVGPSPDWLREYLEALGQRSINNVVDATNYVMLDMGQPLHAFDMGKIAQADGVLTVGVRPTLEGESVQVLTGETYQLPEDTMVLCEGVDGRALDIAGIKGGMASAITEQTTDLFISAANFDAVTIRRTSQAIKLWTDASSRFQNKPSAELVAYGMRDVLALIQDVAGGEVEGVVDSYPNRESLPAPIAVTAAQLNGILGTTYSNSDIETALTRLHLEHSVSGASISIQPPFERKDINLIQDVAEEVGRILGYENVPPVELPPLSKEMTQSRYRGIERIKDMLVERGFVEISTQSFAATGDIELANPLDMAKPYLRTTLAGNMRQALAQAKNIAPRVLGPDDSVRLFELGTVFEKDTQHFSLALGYVALRGKQNKTVLADTVDALQIELSFAAPVTVSDDTVIELNLEEVSFSPFGEAYVPPSIRLGAFKPYSIYPFALRDVAVWTPEGTEESEVQNLILSETGDLAVRIDLFDEFDKEGRTSFAFRLVFEANDRTLSDQDLNPIMDRIYAKLKEKEGWEIR